MEVFDNKTGNMLHHKAELLPLSLFEKILEPLFGSKNPYSMMTALGRLKCCDYVL